MRNLLHKIDTLIHQDEWYKIVFIYLELVHYITKEVGSCRADNSMPYCLCILCHSLRIKINPLNLTIILMNLVLTMHNRHKYCFAKWKGYLRAK